MPRQQSSAPGPPVPLWGQPAAWREANETMDHLIRRHGSRLGGVTRRARAIRDAYESVFRHLDRLCLDTCPWCPAPCCLSAKVWIDFKDLAFLHLVDAPVPPFQLLTHLSDTCRYLSPRGCSLDRVSRPWICTWYICPTQMAILRGREPGMRGEIDQAFAAIKADRAKMAAAFMDVVS